MEKASFSNRSFNSFDQTNICIYDWAVEKPKYYVHIIHGMSEHAARYDEFAKWLNSKNIHVFSSDLRGHGKTAGNLDKVGFFNFKNGWDNVVKDIDLITKEYKEKNPKIPVFILGHSMGSLLARSLAIQYPKTGDGYLFSATSGHPGLKGVLGEPLAKLNGVLFGKKARSKLLDFLTFGDYNKKINPKKTNKDWLTKDEKIVNQYINDPYCMQIFATQFFADLADGVLRVNNLQRIIRMDVQKPILLLSGDMDPVGNYGKGVKNVYDKFISAGLKKVSVKLFEGGRHEMLNETNRDEVYEFIYNWMEKNINND